MGSRKYRLNEDSKRKFFVREHVAEKIIGVVIILIIATIISTVLAFKIVFEWTYDPMASAPVTTAQIPQ